jgi:transcriptional regulator with XRE-family HTH domain
VKLKEWREGCGWSVALLAERLGKTRQAVYAYEADEYAPGEDTLDAIDELSEGLVTQWRGLWRKYRVSKTDGTAADPDADYFVLRLDEDPAARHAALQYAAVTVDEDLARDLVARLLGYEIIDGLPMWSLPKRNLSELLAGMREAATS